MRWRLTVTFAAPTAAVDRVRSLIARNLGRVADVLDVDVTDWTIEQETTTP